MGGNLKTSLSKSFHMMLCISNFCSEEHQRRSPDCAFFTLYSSIKAKDGRSKKTRTSKMSRLSTQSNITAVSEDPSTMETHLEEPLISTTDSAKPAKAQRGKKTAKAKKNAGTAKGRGIKAAHEESQIASSFLEPEDDDFEIKVAPSPVQGTGSRKRKSGESDIVDDDQAGNVDTQSQVPTKKQRRTRASSSAQKAQEIPIATRVEEDEDEAEADVQMTDAEEMPPPTLPASKKRGRAGKKRASSTTRKASSASIASKASLRANVPNDEEIETALEADLDRPLTDEEAETEPLDTERSKDGRLTRTKLGSKKATASVAPTRRGTRASSAIPVEPVENLYPSIPSLPDDESESTDKPIVNDSQAVVAERSPKIKEQNVETSPAGSSQKPIQDEDIEMSQELVATEENVQESVKSTRAQPTRNRQISRQLPTRNTRAPALPAANDNTQQSLDINSSILETQTVQDDSGHETDASVVKPGRTKRGGKQATATGKKAKGGKKVVPKNQITEVVVPAPATDTQTALSTDQTFDVVSVGPEPTEPNATTPVLSEEPAEGTKITTPPKKMKGKAGKNKTAEQKASIAASPEQSDIVVELQEAPPSVPSPSIHSTPQHVLSPQSSDAENQPPSSRPSSVRPPLSFQSPLKSQMTRVPIAITPSNSPSKGGFSKLQSTYPWTMVDLEHVFQGTPSADKENDPSIFGSPTGEGKGTLASPEKKMTVEEWIHFNAQRGENRLRGECERLVGKFEGEGVRALRTLEGIACAQ